MNLGSYIRHNWRHYSRKASAAIDVLSITCRSKTDYQRMLVPPLNEKKLSAIRSSSGLISQMLASNDNATEDAERILKGNYRILSRKIQTDGRFPDWHQDYLSGHRYVVQPYLRYVIRENTGADIIVPWELSRFLFVPSLISAYLATNDEKYAHHFFQLLENWEENNPYLYGINWMCGLDIAIRAFNIALGLIYFKGIFPSRHEKTARLIWAHLRYLQERDLYETKKTVNNHQLVAAVLHYGLLHFFDGTQAEEWRQGAYKIVNRELPIQFHDDGGNYESALLYHQFVLESLYATLGLVGEDSDAFPHSFHDILLNATLFSACYARAWQATPQIGDSSDGRITFHRQYFSWSPCDASYLTDWSRLVFRERSPFSADPGIPETRIFKKSGLGTFLNDRYGAVFCAMPVNMRAAGHNHMDKTSFVLRVGQMPVLIDTGTFCYTSDTTSRNTHRSGRGHNVLLVNKEDQASADGPEAFSAPQYGELGIALDPSNTEPVIRLWHDGYLRVPGLGMVERRIRCLPDSLQILDQIEGQGNFLIELIFNIHPDLLISIEGNVARVLSENRIICSISSAKDWNVSIEQGQYSESYGSRRTNTRLAISARCNLPIEIPTHIAIH